MLLIENLSNRKGVVIQFIKLNKNDKSYSYSSDTNQVGFLKCGYFAISENDVKRIFSGSWFDVVFENKQEIIYLYQYSISK